MKIRLRNGEGFRRAGMFGRGVETALALPLFLLVLIVFGQTGAFGFLHFDDNVYVTANAHVRSGLTGPSVAWAFSTLEEGFWHPLTWLSLMLDVQLYGDWAGGFHWTNVLFHGLSTVILFLVLCRMTGAPWRSAFVAGLFAVHPAPRRVGGLGGRAEGCPLRLFLDGHPGCLCLVRAPSRSLAVRAPPARIPSRADGQADDRDAAVRPPAPGCLAAPPR